MNEAARIGASASERARLRISIESIAVVILALAAGVYYAVCGLLIHMSFRSNGWDLGIFDQVLWSIAHGHGFHYSFREMPYLGDHFQPMLVFLAPLVWLKLGPAPIVVVQGLAFGTAVIPLHAAVRRLGGPVAAWGSSIAYVVSLGVARAVSFDFHPECFVPLLAFTALWGLATERRGVFVASTLAMLPIKEDVAFLALGMCWVAWLGFAEKKAAQWVALASIAYFVVISAVVMREIADGVSSPLSERYPYLGHSASSIAFHAATRPDLIADHLWHASTAHTLLYLFAGTGFLSLLRPKLLVPMVLLLLPPLLSINGQQQRLDLHYGVVPYTFMFVVAATALESKYIAPLIERTRELMPHLRWELPAAAACVAVGMFVWKSPLPPSFSTHLDQFDVDHHSDVAETFVDMVPGDAAVSAQASFVPHLSQRYDIFEFPRITRKATYALVDDKRYVPGYDAPAFDTCRAKLPAFGFALVREEDGIELWERSAADAARLGSEGCG